MKNLIPWVLVVALLGGAAYLFSENAKKNAQLAELRAVTDTVDTLRAEIAELNKAIIPTEEITKLRKDAEDVLKLRNEVRQLRDQTQQLTKQLQSAQNAAQQQQQQVQKLQAEQQQTQAVVQQTQNAVAALNACVNNLRQIDGAIQQWALEKARPANSPVKPDDLAPYFKDGFPKCPAGGSYTMTTVEYLPMCSVAGHAIPQ
ncbi:MAG TPA: hypothetical protein PKA41_03000 [Verrucomicrobiota bacterium]|nr:hypothetical protein [Verrucomicrobiota bacterium]